MLVIICVRLGVYFVKRRKWLRDIVLCGYICGGILCFLLFFMGLDLFFIRICILLGGKYFKLKL